MSEEQFSTMQVISHQSHSKKILKARIEKIPQKVTVPYKIKYRNKFNFSSFLFTFVSSFFCDSVILSQFFHIFFM